MPGAAAALAFQPFCRVPIMTMKRRRPSPRRRTRRFPGPEDMMAGILAPPATAWSPPAPGRMPKQRRPTTSSGLQRWLGLCRVAYLQQLPAPVYFRAGLSGCPHGGGRRLPNPPRAFAGWAVPHFNSPASRHRGRTRRFTGFLKSSVADDNAICTTPVLSTTASTAV